MCFLFTMSDRTRSALRASRNCFVEGRPGVGDLAVWWSQTGSNRRPHACKARALPTELWPRDNANRMVGLGGLEPPTSRLSSARSNQLSYKPELSRPPCVASDDLWLVLLREERETKTAAPRKDGLTGRLIPRIPVERPGGRS
jgi:hypothetical protein